MNYSTSVKFQKDLNAGTLALALLATLAESSEDLYGYDITRRLRQRGGRDDLFGEGSLYPILRNLSAAGHLSSRIVPSYSGPPRRYYRITEAGRQALLDWTMRWNRTREFVDGCLGQPSERILPDP